MYDGWIFSNRLRDQTPGGRYHNMAYLADDFFDKRKDGN